MSKLRRHGRARKERVNDLKITNDNDDETFLQILGNSSSDFHAWIDELQSVVVETCTSNKLLEY